MPILPPSDLPPMRLGASEQPARPGGEYVLYWMIGSRRLRENFALDRAQDWCRALGKPLVVLEPLRAGYQYASDRHHTFVLEGMADNLRAAAAAELTYLPYVEDVPGAGRGLLAALAARACVVVTDETPVFFLPRMLAAAKGRLSVRVETVDGVGLCPLAASPRAFPTAYAFRRHLQRTLPEHLLDTVPRAEPLPPSAPPPDLTWVPDRYPFLTAAALADPAAIVAGIDLDHTVPPARLRGGPEAAGAALDTFLSERLSRYAAERSHPDAHAASGLSPYLHYGHLSAHRVFDAVAGREGWTPEALGKGAAGKRAGWWGMSEAAESFLDELVTWRELGQVFVTRRPEDHATFEGLPDWARATLEAHAGDPRDPCYSRAEFEAAETHDEVWNAAQRELRGEGTLQNYLRMLWGKKILHWSKSPREALEIMFYLNDKYALDGRDPNSVAGITWVLGRFDRAWGPEREVFGKIRYMTCAQAKRKLKCKQYLARYSGEASGRLF